MRGNSQCHHRCIKYQMYEKEAEARVKENQKNLMEMLQAFDFELLEQKFNKRLIHLAKF